MVSTWTASASLSSRRLRSSSLLSVVASSTRWRSHAVSAVAPICSVIAAAWSSSPTCRRSVIRRSPSTIASMRAGQALLERDRLHQRRDALLAQHARPVVQAPVDVLPGVVVGGATSSVVQPRIVVSAAERARGG